MSRAFLYYLCIDKLLSPFRKDGIITLFYDVVGGSCGLVTSMTDRCTDNPCPFPAWANKIWIWFIRLPPQGIQWLMSKSILSNMLTTNFIRLEPSLNSRWRPTHRVVLYSTQNKCLQEVSTKIPTDLRLTKKRKRYTELKIWE